MRIKVDKLDKLFSLLVRERAGWACESCGKYYPEGSRRGLECSHFYGRRHKAVRWHPQNACAHCTACHSRLGGDPVEFAAWIEGYLGRQEYDKLQLMHNRILHLNNPIRQMIAENLQAELNRMLELRAQGRQGRLEFKSPY